MLFLKSFPVGGIDMEQVTLLLEPTVALFYSQIAKRTGLPLEQVLADALFKLAAELSLEALHNKDRTNIPLS